MMNFFICYRVFKIFSFVCTSSINVMILEMNIWYMYMYNYTNQEKRKNIRHPNAFWKHTLLYLLLFFIGNYFILHICQLPKEFKSDCVHDRTTVVDRVQTGGTGVLMGKYRVTGNFWSFEVCRFSVLKLFFECIKLYTYRNFGCN